MEKNNYKIGTCRNYDATQGKEENNSRVANGWSQTGYTWTEDHLRKLTTITCVSPNVYSTDHRSNETWKAANHIMLDFDDGSMTLKRLLAEQKSWNFDSYVYSSQNHQQEKKGKICDRLRVLIPLSEPITEYETLKAVEQFWIHKYPELDHSFMGRARYYAHGTTEVSSFIDRKGAFNWRSIPNFSQYRERAKRTTSKWEPKTEEQLMVLYDKVLDMNQNEWEIRDIPPDYSIYCPFCGLDDERNGDEHNAVIKINDEGMPFLFCQSCKSRGRGNNGVYNFDPVDGYIYRTALNDVLVFIDTLKSNYMGGCVERGLDDFVIRDLGSKDMASQFCLYQGVPYPKIFPRARYELMFDSDKRYDFDQGYVNKYTATEYLKTVAPSKHVAKLPDYIGKLIDHVLAHDKAIKDRFYNDLAWFVQNRKKLITSYIFQGVEGTGKGVLFTRVLQRIFGTRFCTQSDQDAFGTQFNSFLTDNVLVLVNEISGNFSSSAGKTSVPSRR
ncbi:MAG: hypothetical protein U5N56_07995 [Candidatus Marinimicrobia bacterium]|nr:hypothetical protein [Candidatus Neomarinimicrobiota bacterium]